MVSCFECKVYKLLINALCPDHDEDGNPLEPCFQFEPCDSVSHKTNEEKNVKT